MFGRRKGGEMDFENILFESKNTAGLNTQQMEGVLERPISLVAMYGIAIFFVLMLVVFAGRIFMIQVVNGAEYATQADRNSLRFNIGFNNRGVIYDRNGVPLAWNESYIDDTDQDFAKRRYIEDPGFAHLLGFVSYPQKDSSGKYFQVEYEGISGIEFFHDELLDAEPDLGIAEVSAGGSVISESITKQGYDGQNVNLTIDSRLQAKMNELLVEFIDDQGFVGGAGIIMDIESGELLTLTNVPEFDSNILSDGDDRETIAGYNVDEAKPFLNRAVAGLFAPGSIVKPFVATGILDRDLVSPTKTVNTNGGTLAIPNQFTPGQFNYFYDSRDNGVVDMYSAIARSSNIYFFTHGAGYGSNPGLGISGLNEYFRRFGFGRPTGIEEFNDPAGVVPDPEWKQRVFGQSWLLGDSFYTAIGQYGFLVTPLQAAVATAALANGGDVIVPQLTIDGDMAVQVQGNVAISESDTEIVYQAMRQTVLNGTTQSLNLPFVEVASKSGTAERGESRASVNTWAIGFWPYQDPQYAFVVMAEDGPRDFTLGVSRVMTRLFTWMNEVGITDYFDK